MAASSILDTNYLVSGGTERLILEWKARWRKQVAKRDRSGDGTAGELDPDFSALLQRAGSATYEAKTPKNMDRREYYNLLSTLAPFESDGPGDTNEWNLFDRYSVMCLLLPIRRHMLSFSNPNHMIKFSQIGVSVKPEHADGKNQDVPDRKL